MEVRPYFIQNVVVAEEITDVLVDIANYKDIKQVNQTLVFTWIDETPDTTYTFENAGNAMRNLLNIRSKITWVRTQETVHPLKRA